MKCKLLFLWLFTATWFSSPGFTQERSKNQRGVERSNGFLAFQTGIPSGEMRAAIRNNMGDLGFGIGLGVMTNPFSWGRRKRNSPVRIGGEIGYTYYGRFLSEVNINGYRGDYKTSYGIVQLNAVFQLRPPLPASVRPFAEILAGGNFYLSSTKENLSAIESALGLQGFEIGSFASVGFNKGIAAGCNFGKKLKNDDDARITLRISFNWGSDIKYVVRNSLVYNSAENSLEYNVGRAPVKYLMVQLGIGL
jgi:hypothetical protein